MAKKWIKGAIKRPGAFTAKAKAAGMSVSAYANKVTKEGSQASTRTKRQANLAKTLKSFHKGKSDSDRAHNLYGRTSPSRSEHG
jgi:hypothetical protein